jgi:hypothetical protein
MAVDVSAIDANKELARLAIGLAIGLPSWSVEMALHDINTILSRPY